MKPGARQHNAYPADLSLILAADQTLPPLLQLTGEFPLAYDNRKFYIRRETTFAFRFYEPDGFIGFQHEYCCGVNGTWTVTD
jgi:hypothetical protein